MIQLITQHYGYIFEENLIKEIANVALYKEFKENTTIINIDSDMLYIPLVINGAVKILREDKKGEELALYYIEKGDTCAMTLSCCIKGSKSKIKAITETNVSLLMIPKNKMSEWLTKYKSWQEYILQSYHSKLNEFIEAVDSIAFLNMNERIYKYLKDKAMVIGNDILSITHLQIANDLHTSRVVISRLLKALENENKIKLSRNQITILKL